MHGKQKETRKREPIPKNSVGETKRRHCEHE